MFRHDFEFVEGHRSHLGEGAPAAMAPVAPSADELPAASAEDGHASPVWNADGEAELARIPFFVRGKVRRNTEAFARDRGLAVIDSEALYEAKAHYGR